MQYPMADPCERLGARAGKSMGRFVSIMSCGVVVYVDGWS